MNQALGYRSPQEHRAREAILAATQARVYVWRAIEYTDAFNAYH